MEKIGKKTLWQLARELSLESLELVHLIGWTWSPAVIAKTHQLYQGAEEALCGIMAHLTLAEVMALYAAFGAEELARGPVNLFQKLICETDVNVFLTFRAVCSDEYEALKEMMGICSVGREEGNGGVCHSRTRGRAESMGVLHTDKNLGHFRRECSRNIRILLSKRVGHDFELRSPGYAKVCRRVSAAHLWDCDRLPLP